MIDGHAAGMASDFCLDDDLGKSKRVNHERWRDLGEERSRRAFRLGATGRLGDWLELHALQLRQRVAGACGDHGDIVGKIDLAERCRALP